MKYALIVNGVVDTISFEPQTAPWVQVGDNVFGGFVLNRGVLETPLALVVVPEEVSRFQAKAALSQAGLLTQANTIVANSGNALLQLAWDEAVSFKRNSPGINALAPALGLNDAALDQLFITAAQIVA